MGVQGKAEARLIDIAVACCTALSAQQSEMLVRTRDAIAQLPGTVMHDLLADFPSRDQFSRLIQAEAFESAAIRMLGSKLGYMASRSPEGLHLVTVIAPGVEELALSADTLALALAAGLLTAIEIYANGGGRVSDPDAVLRLN